MFLQKSILRPPCPIRRHIGNKQPFHNGVYTALSFHRRFDKKEQILICQPLSSDDSSSESNQMQDNVYSRSPVVIMCLLGWLGADWKHFQKYVDLYMGFNDAKPQNGLSGHSVQCLAHIPPTSSMLFSGVGRRSAETYLDNLQRMIRQLQEKDGREKREIKVAFHVLSGNGVSLLGHCVNALASNGKSARSQDILSRTKCTIVDSAPPAIDVDRFTRGFVGATKTFLRMDMSERPYEHRLLTPLFQSTFRFALETLGYKKQFIEFRRSVMESHPIVPQLYLYSESDELIPADDVREYIAEEKQIYERHGRSSTNPLIFEHNFQDSGHVEHLRKYPVEYERIVREFMGQSLNQR